MKHLEIVPNVDLVEKEVGVHAKLLVGLQNVLEVQEVGLGLHKDHWSFSQTQLFHCHEVIHQEGRHVDVVFSYVGLDPAQVSQRGDTSTCHDNSSS